MPLIKTLHDFAIQPDPKKPDPANPDPPNPDPAGQADRSHYSYLFNDEANDLAAGVFDGTDDIGTISRLKEFEEATRPPIDPPPAILTQLPAAYTYFCQFMNHDISAPVGSLLVDPNATPTVGIIGTADPAGLTKDWRANTKTILEHVVNEQPQPLTLCSLYGTAPDGDRNDKGVAALYEADGKRFRLAKTSVTDPQFFRDLKVSPYHATNAPDIVRTGGVPLIADLRNDGNLILSQLHLALMLAHKKAVDALEGRHPDPDTCFRKARQLITLHYHWLILNDVLPRILSRSVLSRPLASWDAGRVVPGTVPMEFTTAAFRFGHSMVGRAYDFNANFGTGGRMSTTGATLDDLMRFTSRNNMGNEISPPDEQPVQLPDHWVIDWDRLTRGPVQHEAQGTAPGTSERIDLDFAPPMLNSAGDAGVGENGGSIMFRNLLRGFHRRIPFGQKLAQGYGLESLSAEALRLAILGDPAKGDPPPNAYQIATAAAADQLGILAQTPAWLYFLCEARALEGGERVGPTASRIIADTIVSLMCVNAASLLNHEAGHWQPADSVLKAKDGSALTSLGAFLSFATDRS